MGVAKKLVSLTTGVSERGLKTGLQWGGSQLYQELLVRRLPTGYFDYSGVHVLEEEWDLLVILDGCRVDTLQGVASEYDWLPDEIDSVYSIAGASRMWMERTFEGRSAPDLSYITGNPHSELAFSGGEIGHLDEVWKYAWDEELGTIPPRPITDRAIAHARSGKRTDRTIVHYMQPHFPSLTHPSLGSDIDLERVGEKWSGNIWDRLRRGEIAEDLVREAYQGNLRAVLDDVGLLLENVSAERAILTADHGNAFGERGYYGHGDFRVRSVREVPWVSVDATDSGDHEVDDVVRSAEDYDLEDRLKSLGYV
jgi:hypothetical protein